MLTCNNIVQCCFFGFNLQNQKQECCVSQLLSSVYFSDTGEIANACGIRA